MILDRERLIEPKISKYSEWVRIFNLYKELAQKVGANLYSSEVLEGLKTQKAGNRLILDSGENPIVVKKQNKYNVYGWALTGRNDVKVNSKCFRLLKIMLDSKESSIKIWKKFVTCGQVILERILQMIDG